MENTHEKFNINIGKRIMNLRLRRHYTREYLAEIADISPKFLYEIEVGKKGCSSYVLYMLARSLDVSVSFLLQDESEIKEADSQSLYQMLEPWQKKKFDTIIKILIEIIQELER